MSATDLYSVHRFMDKEIEIEKLDWKGFADEGVSRAKSAIQAHQEAYPNNRSGEIPALAHRACLLAQGVSPDLEQEAIDLLLSLDADYESYGAYLLDTVNHMALYKREDLTFFNKIESRLLETKDSQSSSKWLLYHPLTSQRETLMDHVKTHMHPSALDDALRLIDERYQRASGENQSSSDQLALPSGHHKSLSL